MNLAARVFSFVCGQMNLCEIGGVLMPLCYRCTGLYVGAALAIFLAPIRPRPSTAMLWVHGILMLQMLPFGYHLIQHGMVVRLITGQLFGYGLIYYLLLLPAEGNSGQSSRAASNAYFGAALLGIGALLATVFHGSRGAVPILTAIGSIGLVAIVILTSVNIVLFAISAKSKNHDSMKSES